MDPTPELRALADELREATERITTREIAPEQVARALEAARRMRALLDGPRRTSWYETHDVDPRGDHTRAWFDAMSPFGGAVNPLAPPMTVALPASSEGRVIGRVRLSRSYEGPSRRRSG
jgi:hypothetical protein